MIIFKNNLRRLLGNKIRLCIMLILPMLFTTMFLFGSFNTVTVGVVDNDNSQLTKNIINELSKKEFYNVKIIKEDDMIYDIMGYDVDYAIKFENGFEDKFINNEEILIKDYYFLENEYVMNVKIFLESYISNLKTISKNSSGDKQLFYRILNDFENGSLEIHNNSDNTAKKEQAIASIGFTVYFMIFMSVITCGTLLEDRKNGTLSRIFNSPISLKRYLFENLLSYIIVGFLQVITILSIFKFLFHFNYGNGYFYLLILLFTFSLTSITMGLLIVSILKNPVQAYLTVGILASPMAMLGGCYWPIDMMPQWLQNVSKFIPTTWAMFGARDIIFDKDYLSIFDNIGILILFSLAFFIGGIFKKNDFARE